MIPAGVMIPDSWRDPSGWRPTPLQMSVPPDAVGIPWDEWRKKQPLCTRVQLAMWAALHDPANIAAAKAAKTKPGGQGAG